MPQPQQIKQVSRTEQDSTLLNEIVDRVCRYAEMPKETYLNIFFEMGCKAVELIYKENKAIQMDILTDTGYGFWGWFMVEYIRHDEDLHTTDVPYRKYESSKKTWLSTFKLYDGLTNFISYKLV